jgi:hypothetical protein
MYWASEWLTEIKSIYSDPEESVAGRASMKLEKALTMSWS